MIDPIDAETFATSNEPTDHMDYLIVPSLVGAVVAAEED